MELHPPVSLHYQVGVTVALVIFLVVRIGCSVRQIRVRVSEMSPGPLLLALPGIYR